MPQLTIIDGKKLYAYDVREGANLRQTLLQLGFSPYTALTEWLNCRGNGLCATCGVWILQGEPEPKHWHDALAKKWGYSRLSCQVWVEQDMTVALDKEKTVWGKPRNRRIGDEEGEN
jgi:ferredoxin